MSEMATALHAMVRSETTRGMALRSLDNGLVLYPPRGLRIWQRRTCEIVFGDAMVQRLRTIARDDDALRQPGSLTYLEFVAAAVGYAYEQWQRAPAGQAEFAIHLDARADGHVSITSGMPMPAVRRA